MEKNQKKEPNTRNKKRRKIKKRIKFRYKIKSTNKSKTGAQSKKTSKNTNYSRFSIFSTSFILFQCKGKTHCTSVPELTCRFGDSAFMRWCLNAQAILFQHTSLFSTGVVELHRGGSATNRATLSSCSYFKCLKGYINIKSCI